MQRCQVCTNLCDFSCRCRENITYTCYKHSSEHLEHKELCFMPNNQILTENCPKLISALNTKKQELSDLIFRAEDITEKCMQSIYSAFEQAKLTLNQSIDDLNRAIEILSNIDSDHDYKYVSLFSLFFDENYEVFESSVVLFDDNFEKVDKWAKNLFKIVSYTGNYLKNFRYIREDEAFIKNEMARLKLINHAKRKKNTFKNLSDVIKLIKNNSCNLTLQSHTITGQNNSDESTFTSHLLSLCCKEMRSIKVTGCKFNNSQFKMFVDSLKNYKSVSNLEINDSISNMKQVLNFSEFFRKPKNLKSLIIANNAICDIGIAALFLSLPERMPLLVMDLSNNFITKCGAKTLSNALPKFKFLRELKLNVNKLGPEGAAFISTSLKSMLSLEVLLMNRNLIECEGFSHLIKNICYLPHLCVLNIWGNDINDERGLLLAEYLKYMNCLSKLYIDLVISDDVKKMICSSAGKMCRIVAKNLTNRVVVKKSIFN